MNNKFIDPVDHKEAQKKAVEIANKKRDLTFPEIEKNSPMANRFWLDVFWKEFHAMVRP